MKKIIFILLFLELIIICPCFCQNIFSLPAHFQDIQPQNINGTIYYSHPDGGIFYYTFVKDELNNFDNHLQHMDENMFNVGKLISSKEAPFYKLLDYNIHKVYQAEEGKQMETFTVCLPGKTLLFASYYQVPNQKIYSLENFSENLHCNYFTYDLWLLRDYHRWLCLSFIALFGIFGYALKDEKKKGMLTNLVIATPLALMCLGHLWAIIIIFSAAIIMTLLAWTGHIFLPSEE